MNSLLKNILSSDIAFDDSVLYRRVLMINSMLFIAVANFIIFTYVNIVYAQDYTIALFDFITAFVCIITLINLRSTKNVSIAAKQTTAILISFMILFILKNQNENMGLIWSIFIPFFAIQFNGKKVGLLFSIIFYIPMFVLAYNGIGSWNQGLWEEMDFIRFVAASVMLTYIVYLSETAHEKADFKLREVRNNEKNMMNKLRDLSVTDALTGISNRHYFNEHAPQLLSTAKREKMYVSFFIIDIDYFKQYNDVYGHHFGDTTLRLVAQSLKTYIQRDNDIVFRLGGEEFAGIILSKDIEPTHIWLDKLPKYIKDLNIEHTGSMLEDKCLSISIGTFSTQAHLSNVTVDMLYAKADKALYEAKHSGRDKSVISK